MLLEVVMEADPECPRCKALEPVLRKICRELDVPFHVKYMSNKSVATYEESIISRTMSAEWIKKHGLPEHKKSLGRIEPVLNYFRNMVSVPNVIIRWHDGLRTKEIVVKGFSPNDPNAKQYFSNIYSLLRMLKRVVYGR